MNNFFVILKEKEEKGKIYLRTNCELNPADADEVWGFGLFSEQCSKPTVIFAKRCGTEGVSSKNWWRFRRFTKKFILDGKKTKLPSQNYLKRLWIEAKLADDIADMDESLCKIGVDAECGVSFYHGETVHRCGSVRCKRSFWDFLYGSFPRMSLVIGHIWSDSQYKMSKNDRLVLVA